MNDQELSFDEKMTEMRKQIKSLAAWLLRTKEDKTKQETDGVENIGEVMANLMLAYRHLEDASMRVGKVLQHRNGGFSIYDGGKILADAVGNPSQSEPKI